MPRNWWVRPPGAGLDETPGGACFDASELDAVRGWYSSASAPPDRSFTHSRIHEVSETPLRTMPALARELGAAEVLVKDETARFGLPSFKILGAHYAVGQLVHRHGMAPADLACATAGNHGLAVAVAGREHGCEVHVSVPIGTPPLAVDAILAAGAHVVITSVDYDRTVGLMAAEAIENGWMIVSDTAWDGADAAIPRAIMAGYTRLLDEASAQWHAAPDVIVVQAGVGSLAGAVAGWLQARWTGSRMRPRLVIAEPEGAACVLASLRAGQRADLDRCGPTIMAGLRCARVSAAAWPMLETRVDAALTVSDAECRVAQARLAHPVAGDPDVVAGPSGACGLAALTALCTAPELAPVRAALDLSPATRYLAIVTERAPILPDRPDG